MEKMKPINKKLLTVDRRTFVIVIVIVSIALPLIVFVFRKSFFPIINAIKNSIISAALYNGSTGPPPEISDMFKNK